MFEALSIRAGYAQKIAERGENDSVMPGQIEHGGHFCIMRNADRAAGAGKMRQTFRQKGA